MILELFAVFVAFLAAMLTFFSGFGLGTLLMPAFALFFPVPTAIAATAVVHFSNNLFKLGLVGKHANWPVVVKFSAPAALAAVAGAAVLVLFSTQAPLVSYEFMGQSHDVSSVKLVIGVLITAFAILELMPAFASLAISPKYLVLGGLLSGFFGGLSGNQGALRSAFLIKAGLDKQAYVATSIVSAVIVDSVRLTVYGISIYISQFQLLSQDIAAVVVTATLAAFAGSFFGARLLHKVTLTFVRILVASMMILVGIGLMSGLL